MTQLSASEMIQARTSWRSCTGEPIPAEKLTLLDTFVKSKTQGASGKPLRFKLAAAQAGDLEALRGLGTYGFIRGASGFVIGTVDRTDPNLEDYGHALEEIVLYATHLGLATCWLGGTFYKDAFSKRIHVQDHEVVPAVVSVGVPADRRNMVDRLIRNVAGSRKRKDWGEIFFKGPDLQPLQPEEAGPYNQVLEAVRIAPSASNKQPWRLVLEDQAVHFFLARTPGYRKPMFSDLQRIDMGIAMAHFQGVCEEHVIQGTWQDQTRRPVAPEHWEYITSWKT